MYSTQQYISNEDIKAMYSVFRASSFACSSDESSYNIASDYSDGEIIENDHTVDNNNKLTINKASTKQLWKAKGT